MTNEINPTTEVKVDSEVKTASEVDPTTEVKADTKAKSNTKAKSKNDDKANTEKKPLKGRDINVQDVFLGKAKNEKIPVSIFFEKIKMVGIVKNFDQFSVTLDSNGQEQMIYKQGINYIGLPKPKRAFKPRPEGFRPREAREGESGESQSADRPRKPFSPRPHFDSDQRSSEGGGFKKPYERRTDSQGERRYDSPSSFQGTRDTSQSTRDTSQSTRNTSQDSRDSSQRNTNQGSEDSKKVFRVSKPFPKKS